MSSSAKKQKPNEDATPNNATEGDVLVLTKALGTGIAFEAFKLVEKFADGTRNKFSTLSKEEIKEAHRIAIAIDARSNNAASVLMAKYNTRAFTEISNSSLLIEANKLASQQVNEVSFMIHNIPTIAKLPSLSKQTKLELASGNSMENNGGLLICMKRENATQYCKVLGLEEESRAWIIGVVVKGQRDAKIDRKSRFIDFPEKALI